MKTHLENTVAALLAGAGLTLTVAAQEPGQSGGDASADHAIDAEIETKTEMVTFLGVEVREVDPVLVDHLDLEPRIGLVVEMVKEESPAARAGLQENDILVRLDDQWLVNSGQLQVLVRREADGSKVNLELLRKGKRMKIQAVLEKREVPVRERFFWFGEGGGPPMDLPFPHGNVFPAPNPTQIETIIRKEIGSPGAPRAHMGMGKIIHIDPRRNMVFSNDQGTVEVIVAGDSSDLVVRDPDGSVVYEGTADAGSLSEEVRDRLDQLDVDLQMDLEDLPALPQIDVRRLHRAPTI